VSPLAVVVAIARKKQSKNMKRFFSIKKIIKAPDSETMIIQHST